VEEDIAANYHARDDDTLTKQGDTDLKTGVRRSCQACEVGIRHLVLERLMLEQEELAITVVVERAFA
jgi:uncharacterized protein YwlG (UPF0340 family)